MIDYGQVMTTGGLGMGGTLFTSVLSLIHNSMSNTHSYRMKSLDMNYKGYQTQIKDVQDARRVPFKFARRLMLTSVFFFIWILLFVLSILHIPISLPVVEDHNYFFGLIHWSGTVIRTIQGFPFMSAAFCDMMSLMGGLYFGCSFKQ